MHGQSPAAPPITDIRAVLERHPAVVFAYLYGSAASGRTHRRSDLDLGVFFDQGSVPARVGILDSPWLELVGMLQQAFPGDEWDLVPLDRAPPLLSDRIARHGRVVFSRSEPRRLQWVVRTKSRYCDLRDLRVRLDQAMRPAYAPVDSADPSSRSAAGQRNLLVHLYPDVDPSIIYEPLEEELTAFEQFAACVLPLLGEA